MADGAPSVEAFGDAAVLVTLGHEPDPRLAARSQAVADRLQQLRADHPALGRPVPAHASVLVPVDPRLLAVEDAVALVADAAVEATSHSDGSARGRLVDVPVRYGGPDGPDLAEVAAAHGLTPSQVVELHASVRYGVLFIGFAPGFAYLGGLPPELETPRRPSPRERVPPGSVGIAGRQTGIYPVAMPGGWQLIGRSDVVLFDPRRGRPTLLAPGDTVRFVPAG
jgi:KipI family sensor histidine kinase inhibitor